MIFRRIRGIFHNFLNYLKYIFKIKKTHRYFMSVGNYPPTFDNNHDITKHDNISIY